MQDFDIVVSTL